MMIRRVFSSASDDDATTALALGARTTRAPNHVVCACVYRCVNVVVDGCREILMSGWEQRVELLLVLQL